VCALLDESMTYRVLVCVACGLRSIVGSQSIVVLVLREHRGACSRCGGEVRRGSMTPDDNKRLGSHRDGFNPKFPTTREGRELSRLAKRARSLAAAER